jgi:hypothetical protein
MFYEDDTLIIIKAMVHCINNLTMVLSLFSEATGLQINFLKKHVCPNSSTFPLRQITWPFLEVKGTIHKIGPGD